MFALRAAPERIEFGEKVSPKVSPIQLMARTRARELFDFFETSVGRWMGDESKDAENLFVLRERNRLESQSQRDRMHLRDRCNTDRTGLQKRKVCPLPLRPECR